VLSAGGLGGDAGETAGGVFGGSTTFTASSTTDCPAAASPFMTLAALSMIPIVPLMAFTGSFPARIVSSTVSVSFAWIQLVR
jgi:hypothetical protein